MVLTEEWWKDVYSQPGDPCNKEQQKRRLYALRYSMGQDEERNGNHDGEIS